LARTKVLAKFLYESGRTDVPIGLGLQQDNLTGPSKRFISFNVIYGGCINNL